MNKVQSAILALAIGLASTFPTTNSQAAAKGAPQDNGLSGKITAVDKDAKTITVGGKTVTVNETTVITDGGKPAKFETLKSGTEAMVSTFKLGEKLTAVSIKTGAAAVVVPTAKKKK